ncbi:TRAP transporter substrate-binding protein [Polycladidibacter stylochi]|uniref:TRAP transporter substrate-binding protein n=1 Tax=Polycladidibacter stylochi TaxID=1807766 RepID=UPI000831F91D|nr:TRAP transporter substrate-binding protein [Pseudovibrio stylochi]
MKKILALAPALLMATTALSQAADYTLSMAHAAIGEENPINLAAIYFKNELEKRTNGQVEVTLYPGGQMGNDRELVELVQDGTLDLAMPTVSKLAPWDKAFSAPGIPYIFPDRNVALEVLNGEFGDYLNTRLEPMGLTSIGWFEGGFRQITNNVRPITKPDDLKGIKIRTMPVDAHIAVFKHLGANPTPMAFSELYSALQQKVVDGQENPLINIVANRMYEVQDYVSLTNHVYSAYIVLANPESMENLPTEIQGEVKATLQDALRYQLDVIDKEEAGYVKQIEETGTKVNALSPQQIGAFQAKISEIEGELAAMIGEETYKVLKDAVAKASSN